MLIRQFFRMGSLGHMTFFFFFLFLFLSLLNDTSPCQVWLQKVQQLRRYPDKHSFKFWAFSSILTTNTANQSFYWPLWIMMMYRQTKFGAKEKSVQKSHFDIIIPLLCRNLSSKCRSSLSLCLKNTHTTFAAYQTHSISMDMCNRYLSLHVSFDITCYLLLVHAAQN